MAPNENIFQIGGLTRSQLGVDTLWTADLYTLLVGLFPEY